MLMTLRLLRAKAGVDRIVVRLTAASDDAVDAHTFDQMTNNHHLRLDERFTDLLEKYAKPD